MICEGSRQQYDSSRCNKLHCRVRGQHELGGKHQGSCAVRGYISERRATVEDYQQIIDTAEALSDAARGEADVGRAQCLVIPVGRDLCDK